MCEGLNEPRDGARGQTNWMQSRDTAVGQVPGLLCAYYGMRGSALTTDQEERCAYYPIWLSKKTSVLKMLCLDAVTP